ncbi:hypothetical protein DB30_03514 [Enhygromyxa salina]|uniref:Uncharacterized protein n=1 Tax=Enhygromyxa salina TaxID=215803 RepID=A0A0C2D1W3_9BACT|nr:hypothetical protein DB30_03514 [Enhygromyxa salina]
MASVTFGLAACDKGGDPPAATKDDAKVADEGKSDDAAQADAKPTGPDFSKWDTQAKGKAWQGSWLAKENGKIQAWTITGDKVQTWDGEQEKAFTLVVESPCKVSFKNDAGMSFPRPFSVVGGKLRYGAGGYRSGAEVIFCDDSGSVYTIDATGKCSEYEDDFGKWKQKDGDCGVEKNDEGAEVFVHGDPNGGKWVIEGDAIVPRGSFVTEAVEGDFAAAKLARDAKAAE